MCRGALLKTRRAEYSLQVFSGIYRAYAAGEKIVFKPNGWYANLDK